MPNLRFTSKPVRRPTCVAEPVPPPQRFSLTRRAEGGHTIRLVLAGELDLAGRGHLEQALDDAQADVADVVLDLRALTSVDASCLSVVFTAAARSRRDGGMLILLEPLAQVRRILDLTGAPEGVVVLDRSDGVFSGVVETLA